MLSLAFVGVFSALFIGALVIIGLLLPILALISVLTGNFQGSEKIVWVLVIIFLPYLGSILYFLIGRQNRKV